MTVRNDVILSPADQRLKAAFRGLVEAAGGQSAAAVAADKGQQAISGYGRPNCEAFPPVDVVRRLEAVTHGQAGHPHVTRILAAEAGYTLLRIPHGDQPVTIWSKHCAEIAKEAGDVVAGLCTDLADDNDVSPREARKRVHDVDEAIAALAKLRGALVARAEETE